MTTKITRLTDEQKAAMIPWRDKWIAIGLSTEPADREKAEAAYRACYRFAGLRDDVPVVWVQSPIVGAIAAAQMFRGKAVRSAMCSAMCSAVHSAVRSAVYSAVDSAVDSAVYPAVDSAVHSAVYSAVDSAVRSAVDSAVGSAVGSAKLGWHYWFGGSLWSAWPAFESFFRECCGLVLPDGLSRRAEVYAAASQHACYWWPNSHFIMACERPRFIHLEDGRLHNADGHAIEWPDGWGISAWRGTVVPDGWLNEQPPTAAEALQWENIEQRRAACEIIGWDKIITTLGGKMIDRDPDPQIGELIEVNLPGAGKERFLRVECATGRRFAIPVPREIKTALAGNAWTYDIPADLLTQKEHRT